MLASLDQITLGERTSLLGMLLRGEKLQSLLLELALLAVQLMPGDFRGLLVVLKLLKLGGEPAAVCLKVGDLSGQLLLPLSQLVVKIKR